MRAFVVLCLMAVASADKLGYNYHPVDQSYTPGGVSGDATFGVASNAGPSLTGVSSGSSFAAGSVSNAAPSFVEVSSGPSAAVVGTAANAEPSVTGVSSGPSFAGSNEGPSFAGVSSGPSFAAVGSGPAFVAGSSFDAASSGPSFVATSSGPSFAAGGAGSDFGVSQGGIDAASNAAPVAAGGFEKEFYTFTADEQDFNEPAATNQIASSLKQAIRVVFIKGPESSGLEKAALDLAKHASDQKTDIYVLSKQADISELANRLNSENKNVNNRPEVHFVKYRTPEDAAHAQHAIQAQYDALGGPSQHFDGGVASSLNFASQVPVAAVGNQGSVGVGPGPAAVAVGNAGSTYFQVPVAAVGNQGPVGIGSGPAAVAVGNAGSTYFQVPVAAVGNQGSVGVGPGSAAVAVGNAGSTYLPASVLRLFRL